MDHLSNEHSNFKEIRASESSDYRQLFNTINSLVFLSLSVFFSLLIWYMTLFFRRINKEEPSLSKKTES